MRKIFFEALANAFLWLAHRLEDASEKLQDAQWWCYRRSKTRAEWKARCDPLVDILLNHNPLLEDLPYYEDETYTVALPTPTWRAIWGETKIRKG